MKKGIRLATTALASLLIAGTVQAELVGHWTFDDESGTDAVDATGNGYDGQVTNPNWTSNGAIDGALVLDGTCAVNASYLANPLAAISNTFSIAFWCYGDASQPVAQNAFGGYVGGSRQLNCHFPWSGTTIYYDANASGLARNRVQFNANDPTLLYGKWNHWVFTKDAVAGTMAVYVNGSSTPIASGSGLTNHMAGITSFTIGGATTSDNLYTGMLDDFRLYDHVLSTNEISDLYSAVTLDFAVAIAEASPDAGGPPLEVVFSATNSVSSTNIVSYTWDFGDGNSGSGAMATNTYSDIGEYTATLVVDDANGISATNTVDVSVYHFVNAVASASATSGEPPFEVVFTGTNSVSTSEIESYTWDFGDGNSDSGGVVTHTYYDTGVYTSSLVVVDANGLMATNTVELSIFYNLDVDLLVTAEGFSISNLPSFYSNDLAQTYYLSSSFTGGNEGSQNAELFNGLIGNDDGDANDLGEVRLTSGETITIDFDVSVNTNGYDITDISTIAGWAPGGGGRANQGYGVTVTFIDDSVAVLTASQHWAPNTADTNYWTKVTLSETNGLAMASNVKSMTFKDFYNANAGSVVIFREFDILGTISGAPVPTEIVIEYTDGMDSISWATSSFLYTYKVQKASSLTGSWTTFTNVTGTVPLTTVELPAKDQNAEFYRVIAE
jgi:PKD repeat protein